jgi:predicted GTPase
MADKASVPAHQDCHVGLPGVLDQVSSCLADGWTAAYPLLASLDVLRERLRASRFHLAVLGQFKRGKSTFINALLGAPILPAAVVPLTAIPTFIAFGPRPRVRVAYQGDQPPDEFHPSGPDSTRERLHEFVTEEGNPANGRGVARVDVFLPSAMLADGVVLIDTPGIGSTLQHNTDTALQVLPECDAALFVVSADPPITQAEIAYLAAVRPRVVRIFFVLNKVDYLTPAERTQVADFLGRSLREAGIADVQPTVFELSARDALQARIGGDEAALQASGLPKIEGTVLQYLAREKTASLQASVRGKAHVLVEHAIADITLRICALELPISDLEQRSKLFEAALHGMTAERQAARDLLTGDKQRAVAELEAQADQLRRGSHAHLMEVAQSAMLENGAAIDWDRANNAVGLAVPEFFESRLHAVGAAFREIVEGMLAAH